MRIRDVLVGKSALSCFDQSLRLAPLAAQTRCTLSRLELAMRIISNGARRPGAQRWWDKSFAIIIYLLEKVGRRRVEQAGRVRGPKIY